MADTHPPSQTRHCEDSISFAEMPEGIVIVKVHGRGSFQNSVELKELTESMVQKMGPPGCQFVFDLERCTTMDSTFMGVLASVGLRQKKDGAGQMAIVNANDQALRLLQTLGLAHFITVRGPGQPEASQAQFTATQHRDVTRLERIIHMIEAHENLCDIDTHNVVRFESVLKYLRESYEEEKNA